jgi:hypothetical protein
MTMTDLTVLTAQLMTISAVVKVIIDMLKLKIPQVNSNSDMKYGLSMLISIAITCVAGVSILDTANTVVFYLGAVGAGLIAGLGSNVIHEVVGILKTLKDLKK